MNDDKTGTVMDSETRDRLVTLRTAALIAMEGMPFVPEDESDAGVDGAFRNRVDELDCGEQVTLWAGEVAITAQLALNSATPTTTTQDATTWRDPQDRDKTVSPVGVRPGPPPALVHPGGKVARWTANGDHPADTDPGKYGCREGRVVRRFSRPDLPGSQVCPVCGHTVDTHGWIDDDSTNDLGDPGQTVCPGDLVTVDAPYKVFRNGTVPDGLVI